MKPSDRIEIKKSKFGRGVFATRNIAKGEIVEIAPVLVVRDKDVRGGERLRNYVFDWTRSCVAIAFGYGSLFNHSDDNNATWTVHKDRKVLVFRATKPIRKGQEILVGYGYDPVKEMIKPTACELPSRRGR